MLPLRPILIWLYISLILASQNDFGLRLPSAHRRTLMSACTIHCTPYTAHYTLHTIHCTPYTAHHTLHTIRCTLYTAHYTLHNIHCTPYTAHYTLHTIHCTIYTVHHTLHTIHCTRQTVLYLLVLHRFLPWPQCRAHSGRCHLIQYRPHLIQRRTLIFS